MIVCQAGHKPSSFFSTLFTDAVANIVIFQSREPTAQYPVIIPIPDERTLLHPEQFSCLYLPTLVDMTQDVAQLLLLLHSLPCWLRINRSIVPFSELIGSFGKLTASALSISVRSFICPLASRHPDVLKNEVGLLDPQQCLARPHHRPWSFHSRCQNFLSCLTIHVYGDGPGGFVPNMRLTCRTRYCHYFRLQDSSPTSSIGPLNIQPLWIHARPVIGRGTEEYDLFLFDYWTALPMFSIGTFMVIFVWSLV